jgi:phage protein U
VIVGLYGGGQIVFGLAARQGFLMEELTETSKAKFVEHEILGSKPITEFVGFENDEATFSMNFITGHTTSPMVAIPLLKGFLSRAQAYPLIVAGRPVGSFLSQFVLTEVTSTYRYLNGAGLLMSASIEVSMKEYRSTT